MFNTTNRINKLNKLFNKSIGTYYYKIFFSGNNIIVYRFLSTESLNTNRYIITSRLFFVFRDEFIAFTMCIF